MAWVVVGARHVPPSGIGRAGVGEGCPPLCVGGDDPIGAGCVLILAHFWAQRMPWLALGSDATVFMATAALGSKGGPGWAQGLCQESDDCLGGGPIFWGGGHPIWVLAPRRPPPLGCGWEAVLSSYERAVDCGSTSPL